LTEVLSDVRNWIENGSSIAGSFGEVKRTGKDISACQEELEKDTSACTHSWMA
jgi:hypothetical protein